MNQGIDVECVLRLIESERDKANLTDRELERKAGLGRGTLTRVFGREVTPSVSTLRRLAQALGYPLLAFIALAEGSRTQAQEHELLSLFRKLTPDGRDLLLDMASSMAGRSELGTS